MDPVQGEGDLLSLLRVPRVRDSEADSQVRGRPNLGTGPWESDTHGAIQALSALVPHYRFTGEPKRVELGEPSEKKEVMSEIEEEDAKLEDTIIQAAEMELEAIRDMVTGSLEEKKETQQAQAELGKAGKDSQKRKTSSSFLAGLWNSPSSQLRKLIRGPFWNVEEVMDEKVTPVLLPPLALSFQDKNKKNKKKGRKGKLAMVKSLVDKFGKKEKLLREFENNFISASSKAPKESRANFVTQLLKEICDGENIFPLTSRTLKLLSAVLWKAGYKSAEAYLSESKQLHIEAGFVWTQLLELCYKKCKKGVSRDRGPRRKAPEVPAEVRKAKRTASLPLRVPVLFPRELFYFAMVWMLREIELEQIKVEDLVINWEKKEVTLHWEKSKCDQTAGGTMRVLRCLCGGDCEPECPLRISQDLVKKVLGRRPGASHFCWQKFNKGKPATKSQIVRSWSLAFNMKVTGHSGRRTGALNYIRLGWTIPQVSYLGRWRSGVVYDYAQEALQEKAVNVMDPVAMGNNNIKEKIVERKTESPTAKLMEEHRRELMAKLQLEVEEYKRDSKKALKALEKEVKDLSENYGFPEGEPPNVMTIHSKVVHRNRTPVTNTPPGLWRTDCGWYFRDGGFCFVQASMGVTCAKCLAVEDARTQRGVSGIP